MQEYLIIIVVCLIAYFRSLNHNYIIDDIRHQKIRLAEKEKFTFRARLKLGPMGFLRWVRERLYGGGTFGFNIRHDNYFRVALYAFLCAMIHFCLGPDKVSFWAALLFAVNPINNQLSLWANGRRYVVAAILVLLTVKFAPWGLGFYLLTPLFQVTGIFAPILTGQAWALLAIPIFLVLAYPDIKRKIKIRLTAICDPDRKTFTPKRLIIIVKHYGHYFFKMIFPGQCAMIYRKLYYWGQTEAGNKDAYSINRQFWQGILALALTAGMFFVLPARVAAFIFLATIQWCAILPFVQDLADRYCNLPNVFMMWAISYLAYAHLGFYAEPVLLALFVYYACYLQVVYRMYRNIGNYWEYQNFFFPEVPSPRKFQIDTMLKVNDAMAAWYLTREGLRYMPNDFDMLKFASICHKVVGDAPLAYQFALQADQNYFIGQRPFHEPLIKALINSVKPREAGREREKERRRRQMEKNDGDQKK